jgi:hypothetical protein
VRKVELFFFLLSPAQRMIERDKRAEKRMTLSLKTPLLGVVVDLLDAAAGWSIIDLPYLPANQ